MYLPNHFLFLGGNCHELCNNRADACRRAGYKYAGLGDILDINEMVRVALEELDEIEQLLEKQQKVGGS